MAKADIVSALELAVEQGNIPEINRLLGDDGAVISRKTVLSALGRPLDVFKALLDLPEPKLRRCVASGAPVPASYLASRDVYYSCGVEYAEKMLLLLRARLVAQCPLDQAFDWFLEPFLLTSATPGSFLTLKRYNEASVNFLFAFCSEMRRSRAHLSDAIMDVARALAVEAEDTPATSFYHAHSRQHCISIAAMLGSNKLAEILASSGSPIPPGLESYALKNTPTHEGCQFWLLSLDARHYCESHMLPFSVIQGIQSVLQQQLSHPVDDLTAFPGVAPYFCRFEVPVRVPSPVKAEAEDEDPYYDDCWGNEYRPSASRVTPPDLAVSDPVWSLGRQLGNVNMWLAAARGAVTWKWKCRRHAIMAWSEYWTTEG